MHSITKLALIGNTSLTLKSVNMILQKKEYKITSIFGLSEDQRIHKVNSVDLKDICDSEKIKLIDDNNWKKFEEICKSDGVKKIICLGDSRIVPSDITTNFEVLGNHGALLPLVQGGASLVWGRMLNVGHWGISIMNIVSEIDAGTILNTKTFSYNADTPQVDFVAKSDNLTVEALEEVLDGKSSAAPNPGWTVRVRKHTDSRQATKILQYCYENRINVYMPPRTLKDSKIETNWGADFKEVFKISNDSPYPMAYDE